MFRKSASTRSDNVGVQTTDYFSYATKYVDLVVERAPLVRLVIIARIEMVQMRSAEIFDTATYILARDTLDGSVTTNDNLSCSQSASADCSQLFDFAACVIDSSVVNIHIDRKLASKKQREVRLERVNIAVSRAAGIRAPEKSAGKWRMYGGETGGGGCCARHLKERSSLMDPTRERAGSREQHEIQQCPGASEVEQSGRRILNAAKMGLQMEVVSHLL
ncbi:hypothetical protein Hte_011884 [Hypoxylon texense]